jgi:hypothetical protein
MSLWRITEVKDLKSASKCIHVVVNRSFAMLRMTKKRQGLRRSNQNASVFEVKRLGVLIKTSKRFIFGLFTALPNAGQWLPLPASDTNADADYNSATSILLPTTGIP